MCRSARNRKFHLSVNTKEKSVQEAFRASWRNRARDHFPRATSHLTCPFDRFSSACCYPRWIFVLHWPAPASLVPPCRLSARYRYCFRPSASAAVSARFDPAAPAVGVSRRDKNCRKMTYSRVETQKHEDHTNEKTDSAKIDDLIAVGWRRSKAGHAGRDTGQWCRR